MKEYMLLNDVAKLIGVKGYQITYALTNGLVEEPRVRIGNKRIFDEDDVQSLAKHFGVTLEENQQEKQ